MPVVKPIVLISDGDSSHNYHPTPCSVARLTDRFSVAVSSYLLTRQVADRSRQSVSSRRRTRTTTCCVSCNTLSLGTHTDPRDN